METSLTKSVLGCSPARPAHTSLPPSAGFPAGAPLSRATGVTANQEGAATLPGSSHVQIVLTVSIVLAFGGGGGAAC